LGVERIKDRRQSVWLSGIIKEKPRNKLYHYTVNFENFKHPEAYHLCWQHIVRNNSLRRILTVSLGKIAQTKMGWDTLSATAPDTLEAQEVSV